MLGPLLAAQLAIIAQGPDTASSCMPIRLTAAIRVPGTVAPRLQPSASPGFQILRTSRVSRVEPDGSGRSTTLVEATADVATPLTGRVALPQFVAVVDGRRVVSAPAPVEVHPLVDPRPVILVQASVDGGAGGAAPDSLVVGQQVDYVVDVLLNEPARMRLRRNPTFFPPEMSSVLAYDLALPTAAPRQGRRCFEAMSYRRALFPLYPGRIAIPPAVLTYSLPVSTSFFSREESFEARTDSVRFEAVEPPDAGRPADFGGAVGTMQVTARAASATARVGDPVVLTVRVEGTGNVKLLPRPAVAIPWATLAPAEERVSVDSSAARIRGSKEFDWIVTPRREGDLTIPPVPYSLYDPDQHRYLTVSTAPIPLRVTAGTLASADTARALPAPVRTVLREERPSPLPSRPGFWMALALAPVPAGLARLMRRRRGGGRRIDAARRLQGVAESPKVLPPRELRRLFLHALRDRVPSVGADHAPLGRVLRRAGVSDAAALEAEAMLRRLDSAAFAPGGVVDVRTQRDAWEIVRRVDAEAVGPVVGVGRLAPLLLASLLLGGSALALVPDSAQRIFSDGVRAYQRGQFSIAQRQFAEVSRQLPRATDAWANLGAAAWEARDSAEASRAWHRAIRLDPLDADARDRLGGLQSLGLQSPAYVAPVSLDLLGWAVLALWCSAWLVLAVPHASRPAAARPVAGAAIAAAVVATLAILELRDRLEARDLAVLAQGRPLASGPSADAEPVAAALAGEAGRTGAHDGAWVHLTLDDARQGWVPRAAVVPIREAAAPRD